MPAADAAKPARDYVRIPSDMSVEINRLAARYDVPARSLTRVLLCLGLEVVRVDQPRASTVLNALVHAAVPTASR